MDRTRLHRPFHVHLLLSTAKCKLDRPYTYAFAQAIGHMRRTQLRPVTNAERCPAPQQHLEAVARFLSFNKTTNFAQLHVGSSNLLGSARFLRNDLSMFRVHEPQESCQQRWICKDGTSAPWQPNRLHKDKETTSTLHLGLSLLPLRDRLSFLFFLQGRHKGDDSLSGTLTLPQTDTPPSFMVFSQCGLGRCF
jgi:hypothetical protein